MNGSTRGPVAVERNRWIDLPRPDLGSWEPKLRVSVVVPYYERPTELIYTLAGLANQTYPANLVEIIVVDDGSPTKPPVIPDDVPFTIKLLTQEDLGYGLARARNNGAREAQGEVLVFLDCDMVPERQHIEAHARWHHIATRLVTVGFRFHAEFHAVSPSQIGEAVRRGRLGDQVTGEVLAPFWIDDHLERTSDLLGPQDDFYLMMSGGNLGVDPDLYWEAGGSDEAFDRWGGEDNELGYRLLQLGAVVVPERKAVAWHQGEGHTASTAELRSIAFQMGRMRNRIADRSMRPPSPGRMFLVPRLIVSLHPEQAQRSVIEVSIDALLASDMSDLVVAVDPIEDHDTAYSLDESYKADPRVLLSTTGEDVARRFPFSPYRLDLPAGFGMNADTLDLLFRVIQDYAVGSIHVTLPGRAPALGAELRTTRAVNRVRHAAGEVLDDEIGRLFGERWVSGAGLGFWRVSDIEESFRLVRRRRRPSHDGDVDLTIALLEEDLVRLRSRRALRLVDGIGAVLRARSLGELADSFGAIAGSLRKSGSARVPRDHIQRKEADVLGPETEGEDAAEEGDERAHE